MRRGACSRRSSLSRPRRSRAYAQNVPIVRDAEIEALVRDYARPILKAAGLSKSGIDIILVNDRRFNAFVAGRRMFINTGALLTAETPNEIIGVHRPRGRPSRRRPPGAPARAAGARADHGDRRLAARRRRHGCGCGHRQQRRLRRPAWASPPAAAKLARRGLLGYQRTEETTADRSAITYLEATGQSAKGMLKTFERFQSALSLSGAQVDPYQISHPMPRDRIANLEDAGEAEPLFRHRSTRRRCSCATT